MTPSTSLKAAEFINSVLQLQPRIAVFDCDGTLWAGDAGEGFFDWELKRHLVSDDVVRWARSRYADYKAGKVDEETMCGEMVTMHRGLPEAEVQKAATEYFEQNLVRQIFPEMRELVGRLQQSGSDVWAVSSSNLWLIRAGMKYCGISPDRILAAAVQVENGIVTDRLVRVPSGDGKTKAIRDVIRTTPDAAFGNSRWDLDMLKISGHAFAVNPNPDLEKAARQRGWTVYWPDGLTPHA
ncbi:MAG TPA: haloacid dehalogenase-like hydrolase [Terriglobales bacterium]|nr:haloacid dehalogenase-like hydrolase [Terriglobales bacterium]